MAGSVRVTMTVNGAEKSAEVEPRLLLVYYLRETLGLGLRCSRSAEAMIMPGVQ